MGSNEKKIAAMLKSDDPELQCAAARVLGELKSKDEGVIRSLGDVLTDNCESARLYALEALKSIGEKASLEYVIPRLSADDPERRAAAAVVTAVGNSALPELQKELPNLSLPGKLAAAEIIISIGTEASYDVLLDALSSGDFDVCRHICDLFRDQTTGFSDNRRDVVYRKIIKFLESEEVQKNEVATMAGLRLLGYLNHEKSLETLVPYLDQEYTPAIRRHALLAVSALLPVRKPRPEFVGALLKLLSERSHPDLMETSLRILNGLNIPASLSDEMMKLLYNRHSAVRKLALKSLEGFGTIKATKALLNCLGRADWELTSETLAALRRIKHTPDVILSEVEKTNDKEKARRLAGVLKGGKFAVSNQVLSQLSKRLLKSLDKEDQKLDIYVTLLASLSEEHLVKTVLSKVDQLKKAGDYAEAERHLRMLTQLGPPVPEVKYELGVIRLKLSKKNLSSTERAADPALALIASLVNIPKFKVAEKLQIEANILKPADYYYLGRHFAESQGEEKAFGLDMLRFLVENSPESQEAAKAKKDVLKLQP